MSLVRQANRSGKNQCAVCLKTAPLVEHHIQGRDIPDYNRLSNRCWICPTCHDRIHLDATTDALKAQKIILEGWFSTTNGRRLVWHYADQPSVTGRDATPPSYAGKD